MDKIRQKVIYRPELSECGVPLGLRSVGEATFPSWQATGVREIDFIQILWTLSGEGRVLVGENEYSVGKGYVALCLPNSRHLLSNKNSIWEYRWISIDGPYALSIINSFQIPKTPFLAGDFSEDRFRDFEEALKDPSPNGERLASSKAYDFIVHLSCRSPGKKKEGAVSEEIASLLSEIEFGISNPELNVNHLSERTGRSRFSIHRIFREELGMPPKNYIDSVRLQRVLSLLRETDLTLASIAMKSGFANANYLSKFFRKKMNCTPIQFRNAGYMP